MFIWFRRIISVIYFDKTGSTNQDRSLEEELKQGYIRKAHDLAVDALMLYKTTFNLSHIDKEEAATKIIKSTKSLLESLKPPQDFGSWYPKVRDSGNVIFRRVTTSLREQYKN